MLIYLDLETTGYELDTYICSISLMYDEKLEYELIKPPVKLKADAMMIHNITNEMVEDCVGFKQSKIYESLDSLNNIQNSLVVHNAEFILGVLSNEGFVWQGKVVDTMRVSKHLVEDLDNYSLEYLRYEFGLYKRQDLLFREFNLTPITHNAASDLLFVRMLLELFLEDNSLEKLQELSNQKILLKKFTFGKYKTAYIEEVFFKDTPYLIWLLNNASDKDEDLRYTLQYYLKDIL